MSDNEGEGAVVEPTEGKATADPEPLWIRHAATGAFTAWSLVLVLGVIAGVCGWGDKFGQFGDAFGVVTGLLTALALLASVRSIGLQRDELAETREEMARQRAEMEASREVAQQQLEATRRTHELMDKEVEAAALQVSAANAAYRAQVEGLWYQASVELEARLRRLEDMLDRNTADAQMRMTAGDLGSAALAGTPMDKSKLHAMPRPVREALEHLPAAAERLRRIEALRRH